MPRFSVLVPTYNRSRYLRHAIDSVLAQTFADFELWVIDDGSTDDTPQLLASYGSRIKVIRQSNQGQEVARNKAAAQAQGEYLAMLDDDDVLTPAAFAAYDQAIRAFASPPLVIGAMTYLRDDQPMPAHALAPHPVEVLKLRDFLSKDVSIASCNSRIVVRKQVFEEVGGYRSNGKGNFRGDDFNLILKLSTYSPCIVVQKPFTVVKRVHSGSISRNLAATADDMLTIVRFEREGIYPGGKQRRKDRQACIGSLSSAYAMRYCWRGGERKTALRLLYGASPMVLAAIQRKISKPFRHAVQPIVLPDDGPVR